MIRWVALLLTASTLVAVDAAGEAAWWGPIPPRGPEVLRSGQWFGVAAAGGGGDLREGGSTGRVVAQASTGWQYETASSGMFSSVGNDWVRLAARFGTDPDGTGRAGLAAVGVAAASTLVAYGKVEVGLTARRGPFLDADGGVLLTRVAVHLTSDTMEFRVGTMVRMLGTQGPIAFHLSPGFYRFESRETSTLFATEGLFVEGGCQVCVSDHCVIALTGDHRSEHGSGPSEIAGQVSAVIAVIW